MRRLLRWYGAGPLHLLSLLACFGLAGYAAAQLVSPRPLGVAVWLLGAVIGHDLLLVPLYSLADRSAVAVFRHRAPGLPAVASINYVRVPAALSGLLLLVWFPLILRLTAAYHASTTLSPDPYLWHWLAVTGALFLLSAVAFAVRLRRTSGHAHPAEGEAQARPAEGQGAKGDGIVRHTGPADDDGPRDDGPPDERGHAAGHGQPGSGGETPPAVPEPSAGESPGEMAPATAAAVPETAEPVEPAPQEAAAADPGAVGPVRDQPDRSVDGGDGERTDSSAE
jgi:hypothetical protein